MCILIGVSEKPGAAQTCSRLIINARRKAAIRKCSPSSGSRSVYIKVDIQKVQTMISY